MGGREKEEVGEEKEVKSSANKKSLCPAGTGGTFLLVSVWDISHEL